MYRSFHHRRLIPAGTFLSVFRFKLLSIKALLLSYHASQKMSSPDGGSRTGVQLDTESNGAYHLIRDPSLDYDEIQRRNEPYDNAPVGIHTKLAASKPCMDSDNCTVDFFIADYRVELDIVALAASVIFSLPRE